jgi:hypothetical protein
MSAEMCTFAAVNVSNNTNINIYIIKVKSMKRVFTLMGVLLVAVVMMAQPAHAPMKFVGASYITLENSTDHLTDGAADEVLYNASASSVTIPELHYNNLVIPPFAVSGLTMTPSGGMQPTSIDLSKGEYVVTVPYEESTKDVTGKSFSATFTHGANTFDVETTFTFGVMKNMGIYLTYHFSGVYQKDDTGIEDVRTATQRDAAAYNLAGQRVGENHQGLVIIGGKKYIRK